MAEKTEQEVKPTAEEIVKAEQVKVETKLSTDVEKGLEKAFPDPDSTPEPEPEPAGEEGKSKEATPDEPAAKTDEPDEPTPDEGEPKPAEEGVKAEEDKSTPEEKPADKESQIPEQYVRAAIHQKWSAEDIKELQEANPKLALKTFKNLYETTNRLSQDFAAAGRKRMEELKKPVEKKAEVTSNVVDIKKLKEDYGDDPIVNVVEALVKKIDQLAPKTESPSGKSETEIRAEIRENQAVEKQVNSFFGDKSMEPYSEFYGTVEKSATDWSGLTGQQQSNRMAVLNLADQICIGAQVQGKEMVVDEAMDKAHLIVSARVLEAVVRDDIKKKAVKFSKAKTLHPHATDLQIDGDKPKTDKEMYAKVAAGLKKVWG